MTASPSPPVSVCATPGYDSPCNQPACDTKSHASFPGIAPYHRMDCEPRTGPTSPRASTRRDVPEPDVERRSAAILGLDPPCRTSYRRTVRGNTGGMPRERRGRQRGMLGDSRGYAHGMAARKPLCRVGWAVARPSPSPDPDEEISSIRLLR